MNRPPTSAMADRGAPRGKRSLSEEERALWDSVAKQVKPLRKKPREARLSATLMQGLAAERAATPRPAAKVAPPKPSKPPAPALTALSRRERSRLSRGTSAIEARLDLHGMTQSRAHRALFGFLQRAHQDGLTFVLVITGKGKIGGPRGERGVLRHQVPQWLGLAEFRSLVVGYEEAHIGHGGEGALYVRIRRART
jgi:DNA-nicking Smr family endonuclease